MPYQDGSKHLSEHHLISLLDGGETLQVEDVKTVTLAQQTSLQAVFNYLSTLHDDSTLKEFSFLPEWQSLSDHEKRKKYSKYSCHELNYFLFRKDPAFFEGVVLPFLRTKLPAVYVVIQLQTAW